MYPVQNADGGSVLQTARNYPIDATTEIQAGAVVKLSGGKVVLAAAAETGGILGIAAEFHSGKEDALNLRANGKWILVCDNPTLIFECAAPMIKAASGSATTIVPATGDVDASAADDAFNNAVLVLRRKAASSTNTDAVGTQIVVTDYAKTGTVMTKASGGAPGAGDVYQVYPVIGAAIGGIASLGDKRLGITLKTVGATKLRCIGHDYERGAIKLMAIGHALT
ncbi:hypothetical protein [Agathobaculum sp.]|uniref:hypothetical protein n=1 Tax=Agathobaculum sp. TaxID=2048138 RepID=UPI00206A0256|nr:MAG TPA_asm: hypothetical protein [Bacteriophage sp.]